MMEIKVRLFATLKDKAGQGYISLELSEPATVNTLLEAIAAKYPALKLDVDNAVISVDREFAGEATPLTAASEVAIFPPVSGGTAEESPHPTYFSLAVAPPDLQKIHAHLTAPDVGAIVTFTGTVRGETQRDGLPAETVCLEYEAYEGMAQEKMSQIAREIWEKWPLVKGVAIVQRVGQLAVGEATTLVACAAGHRDQGAFEAARYGIDRLKEIVPVWKKEVGKDKSVWIEGDYRPTEADN